MTEMNEAPGSALKQSILFLFISYIVYCFINMPLIVWFNTRYAQLMVYDLCNTFYGLHICHY